MRKKVLDYVAGHPGADTAQIARALGMAGPAVRHHLSVLRSDSRIMASSAETTSGRGRPRLGYRVTEALEGNNLAMVADDLLGGWKEGAAGHPGPTGLASRLAHRLSQELRPAQAESSAARRLAELVEQLNQLHYRSRWEAGAEGPRLIFGHCPYAAVVAQHPELCQMDVQAVAGLLSVKVEQKAKIDLRGHGAPNCVLALKYV